MCCMMKSQTSMDKKNHSEDANGSPEMEKTPINSTLNEGSKPLPSSAFEDSTTSMVSDTEVINDDGQPNGALAEMQEELRAAEQQQQEQAHENTESKSKNRVVSVVVTKPSTDSPIGISMKTSKGVTRIVAINESGLLKDTNLRAGLALDTINGVKIKSAKHARSLIQACTKKVKIVAHDPSIEV